LFIYTIELPISAVECLFVQNGCFSTKHISLRRKTGSKSG